MKAPNSMLSALRAKFIALNMLIVAVVLTVAFGGICYLNYQQDLGALKSSMSTKLDRAANSMVVTSDGVAIFNFGEPPQFGGPLDGSQPPPEPPDGMNPPVPPGSGELPLPPSIGGGASQDQLTPIVMYAIDDSGTITSLSSFSTALISDDYLGTAIESALSANSKFGVIGDLGLYYEKRLEGDVIFLAFADVSATSDWKTLSVILSFVGLLVLVGFFVISVFFSRWALRPVATAWDQQRQFVADASHELKTPLTVILANAAILRSHPEENVGSQEQWIESTEIEAKRMQHLVNDMLDLARLDETSAGKSKRENIDLSYLVEAEMLQFESVAFERGVSIEGAIEPGLVAKGSMAQLQRMMRTLIDNACKYADIGSCVNVALRRETRAAVITVANEGVVIDAEDLPHIFDRFYRADKARNRESGGYGLGLSIAREIARAHGGDIKAASSAQTGTVFTVTLPISK